MAVGDSRKINEVRVDDVSGDVTKIFDDEVTTAGVVYIGVAVINSFDKQAEAIWSIKKIVKPVEGVSVGYTVWADGNTREDNKWSLRDSLTYN